VPTTKPRQQNNFEMPMVAVTIIAKAWEPMGDGAQPPPSLNWAFQRHAQYANPHAVSSPRGKTPFDTSREPLMGDATPVHSMAAMPLQGPP
jgi:hypothetical protein